MATDGGSLEDSEIAIQRRCACSQREFRNAWPAVRQCFEARDGRLYNAKLTYALSQACKSFDARSSGGKATAELRWGKKDSDSSASSSATPSKIAERLPSSSSSSSSSITKEEPPIVPQGGRLFGEDEPPKEKPKRAKKPKAERPAESPQFEEFYLAYWRHEGRSEGWDSYRAHVNGSHADVMAAVKAQTPKMLAREVEHRPLPSTWLNRERWKDTQGVLDAPAHQAVRENPMEARRKQEMENVARLVREKSSQKW